jgi:hypothetical protein
MISQYFSLLELKNKKSMETHEASWLAFIKIARKTFGVTPRPSDDTPSSRTIYNTKVPEHIVSVTGA